ncbi:MAG: sulfur carrier protein ThiS [Proteobacteria bacterium]|nr:sulfur carrier protein ThiS [Pseudomonadota bacterium]MDA1022712.1 sulfur carrier protein ThiS [Pseudomonadota bacterium]
MNLTINGEQRNFDAPITLEQLLGDIGLDPRKVAVECNLEIVPKSSYGGRTLDDGDKLEIVHFIGGGAPDEAKGTMSMDDKDTWTVAGRTFTSRLIIGTGKYKDYDLNRRAAEAAGSEIITVAVRRVNLTDPDQPLLVDYLDPEKYTYLPNTAGCFTSDDALRTLRLAREAGGWDLVKLEILGDEKTLYPMMPETLEATEILTKEGFQVMVYCSDDPIMCKRLEDVGAVAIMPLGAPIGSGLGIQNPVNIRLIKEQSSVPVIVDAGVGTASDATIAMELGCDGVLMNTAIAGAKDPVRMARAMKAAVEAGRDAFLAGRMAKKMYADPSSPLAGLI